MEARSVHLEVLNYCRAKLLDVNYFHAVFEATKGEAERIRSEQIGFANLLIGLFGAVRNPLAHATKVSWPMTEQDALDIFGMVSLVHRKLDDAQRVDYPV
ncbi:TIGR02391 family protein [Pseudomonas asiatica]|uniref:TIGR02391 family protein n=1 Tax=Pseudomonas asiatica TaxID=2219225 RepID=UPI001E70C987|nr:MULTISPECIES: TIGR02391 family protein [Pseudomonas]CAB5646659.1 Protein of uncharacterised function (Hypoth_ymh) [Pseudomonas putida]WPU59758.1 TIGR02391 family protein [Pseudomonas asiatica]CAB5654090.1 Protein of uncharacterised function (Hypoth_ymh) [Pseudomonas putida]CAB5698102.1 Protein of uncharacterised function (Hypoth_ymh) [Pseudomonas putida]CAB5711980.1 Protein of uncharacterised function (Hypoth_ymh) [Pseudomonas putida]